MKSQEPKPSQGPTPTTQIEDSKSKPEPKPLANRQGPMQKQPFDFAKVKVIIKRGKQEDAVVYLDKKWTLENI